MSRFSFVRSLIGLPRTPDKPSIESIAQTVARETGLPVTDIMGASRTIPIAHARQEAMRRAYRTGQFSTTQIGRVFGRDHTTVIHGINAAMQRLAK